MPPADRVTADVLVPVPLHPPRERNRGYNQAELLAREVGLRSGISVDARLLRRTRNTSSQVTLRDRYTRRRNTEGAFECASSLKSSRVLLIDDVVTTGGTMSACADALKAAEDGPVYGALPLPAPRVRRETRSNRHDGSERCRFAASMTPVSRGRLDGLGRVSSGCPGFLSPISLPATFGRHRELTSWASVACSRRRRTCSHLILY